MQEKWSPFEDDVDDMIPIAIRSVQVADEDVETEEDSNKTPISTPQNSFRRSSGSIQIFPS